TALMGRAGASARRPRQRGPGRPAPTPRSGPHRTRRGGRIRRSRRQRRDRRGGCSAGSLDHESHLKQNRERTAVAGTVANPEGITNPPIDELLDKVSSKYQLVIYAAKRARQINAYYAQLGEGLLEYVGP